VVVIGTLTSLAVPAIFGMRRKAKTTDAKAVIKDSVTAIAQLFDDNDRSWPYEDPDNGDLPKSESKDANWRMDLFGLDWSGPVTDDATFVQASNPTSGLSFETWLPTEYSPWPDMMLWWTDQPSSYLPSDDNFDPNDPFWFRTTGVPVGPPVWFAWDQTAGLNPASGGLADYSATGPIVPEPGSALLVLLLAGSLALRRSAADGERRV
jgi:type II secretory pathway pseudopilin PulG